MNNSYNYCASAPATVKKKGFPGWAAVLIALVVILAGAGLVWSLLLKNPLMSVERAWKTSLKAAEASEVGEIASAAADSGSVELSLDARDLAEDLVGFSLNAGARVKFYFDLDKSANREAAVEAALSLNGAEAADLLLYTDGESAAVKSEAILGAKSYGFKFADVREKFDSSVFGPGGSYPLNELFGLELTGEDLGELFDSFAASRGSEEETKKVFESVSGHILKMLPKYGKITKESGELVLLSEKTVKTQDVKIYMEGEGLADFLRAVLEEIRDNERLNEYLNNHADLFEKSGKTFEDYRTALGDALSEIEEDREEIAQYEATLSFRISKKNRQLIGAELGVISKRDAEKRISVPINIGLTCGPDWRAPEEISFFTVYDDTLTQFHCTTVRDEKGGAKTDLYAAAGDETIFDGTLTTGGADGAFALDLNVPLLGAFGLNGSYHRAEKELTVLTLDSVRVNDAAYSLGGASVLIREKDTMPVISDYRDVLTMSEEDAAKIGEDVDEFVETFKDKLADMLGILAFLLF